jgi:serine protease Do
MIRFHSLRLSLALFIDLAFAAPLFAQAASPASLATSAETAAALSAHSPQSAAELRLIQAQLQRVIKQVLPATVGVEVRGAARSGIAAGSGVIVNKGGLVLTAGHVIGQADRHAWVELPDGRRLRGHSLGANHDVDAGMIQIDDPPLDLPFAPVSEGAELANGQWVVTIGQPGGIIEHRSPPVRFGRVLFRGEGILCSDCKLVGGDSGGPLFNMQGEVVGIHSSIGPLVTHNFHVPITAFRKNWHRLLAGEVWGGHFDDEGKGPQLGVRGRTEGGRCLISEVFAGMPAETAGVEVGDVIVAVDNRAITTFDELKRIVYFKEPGVKMKLKIERGGAFRTITVELTGAE